MRTMIVLAVGLLAGCVQEPTMAEKLAELNARSVQRAHEYAVKLKEQREARDQEYKIKAEQMRAEEADRKRAYEARRKAREDTFQAELNKVMPVLQSCIRSNAERLSRESTETADVVAVAVIALCKEPEEAMARAQYRRDGLGEDTTGFIDSFERNITPRIVALVVEARAREYVARQSAPEGVGLLKSPAPDDQ